MEVTYPGWLNKDFIEKALTSAGDSSVKVASYSVTNATAAGDNYLSEMYKVTASMTGGYRAEVTSVIVKCSRQSQDPHEVRVHDIERLRTTANFWEGTQFLAD
jgi:hypothetical protein